VLKNLGKQPLRKTNYRWKDIIKMDYKKHVYAVWTVLKGKLGIGGVYYLGSNCRVLALSM
jgi:hypothetical protein